MKIFRSLEEARAVRHHRPVVTLGVFDGVHAGHRFLLDNVLSLARERQGDALVVTFGRHPRAVIEGRAPKLITSLPHRLRIFDRMGLEGCLVLEFDDDLRAWPARDFARTVFGEVLHAEVVVLGYNNRFGQRGEGDIFVLREVGATAGFEARQLPELRLGDHPLSSTTIRQAILAGDLEQAALMLGRPFSVLGTVVRGQGLGRQLGFPTANLDLHHEVRPPRGVYGCEVLGPNPKTPTYGLVNIGVRPTVGGNLPEKDPAAWESRDQHEHVEVHLLDQENPDLYDEDLEVLFLTRLRDEQRFPNLQALVEQIGADCDAFRAWLARR